MQSIEEQRRLQSSLLVNKKPGFSSAVAITQKAINDALRSLLDIERPDFQNVNLKGSTGTLVGVLESAKVRLYVPVHAVRRHVNYVCTFESGNITLEYGKSSETIDIANWVLVWFVPVGSAQVAAISEEGKRVRKALDQVGDYSIQRVYLDFASTSGSFNQGLSSFGTHKWTSDEQKRAFLSLMAQWGKPSDSVTSDPQMSTFCYTATTCAPQTVNPRAPTFPPTSRFVQAYPWLAVGQDEPHAHEGLDAEGDKNMLLYLEMTENLPSPLDLETQYFPWTGNFATMGMKGSICISSRVFWERFFLRESPPKVLMAFNEATFAWCRDAKVTYTGFTVTANYKAGIGKGSNLDMSSGFYGWVRNGPHEWTWSKTIKDSDDNGWGGMFSGELDVKCTTDNKISIESGCKTINLSGRTHMQMKANVYSLGIAEGGEASATMTWKSQVVLESVLEGGVAMKVIFHESDVNITNYQDSWPADIHHGDAEKFKNHLSGSLEVLKGRLKEVNQLVGNVLEGAARFVLPGGGTFFYKNPMFNDHGDLMLELGYDGAS